MPDSPWVKRLRAARGTGLGLNLYPMMCDVAQAAQDAVSASDVAAEEIALHALRAKLAKLRSAINNA